MIFSQKAVLSLTNRNVIYIGINNPIDFAVEGYSRNEIKVATQGCLIDSQYKYLTASVEGKCKVKLSYLKGRNIDSQIIELKIKKIPRVEAQLGSYESGTYSIEKLMAVDSLNIEIPFDKELNELLNFRVTRFACAYVPRSGNACFYNSIGNKIPQELKKNIFTSNNGDKILIDEIICSSKSGNEITKRSSPIAITIKNNSKNENSKYAFSMYQAKINSAWVKYNDYVYDCNNFYNFKTGILRNYKINGIDTILCEEIKMNNGKLIWKKTFYSNGSLSLLVSFESNDSLGKLTSYYENGKLKAEGNVISFIPNIYQSYRGERCYGDGCNTDYLSLADSLLLFGFAPYSNWKGYYNNGKLALACELKLFKLDEIIGVDNDAKMNMQGKKQTWLKEAFNNKDNFYISRLTGHFVTYKRNGDKGFEFNY